MESAFGDVEVALNKRPWLDTAPSGHLDCLLRSGGLPQSLQTFTEG